MTQIAYNNMMKRWNVMANADLGTDVQPLAISFVEFFKRAANSHQVSLKGIENIIPTLRALEHNTGDVTVTTTLDLYHATIVELEWLEWELMVSYGWEDKYEYARNN